MKPAWFGSPRFAMRPWRREDLESFFAILGDPRVAWWDDRAGDFHRAEELLERVVLQSENEPEGRGWFAVRERESGEAVANVVLRTPPVEAEGLEIGWHVRPDHWGRGIATEAASASLEHGRAHLRERTFIALIDAWNTASLRIAAKLGMRYERDVVYKGRVRHLFRVHGPGIERR